MSTPPTSPPRWVCDLVHRSVTEARTETGHANNQLMVAPRQALKHIENAIESLNAAAYALEDF